MYSKLDDLIALLGVGCLIGGIYLWLGLPASLIAGGIILIYIGARIEIAPRLREQAEESAGDLEVKSYADNPLWSGRARRENK